MTRKHKQVERFLKNPSAFKYRQIESILCYLGFYVESIKGSHRHFLHYTKNIQFTIPVHSGDCWPVYKKEVVKIIKSNFPEYEDEDETDEAQHHFQ